MDFLNSVQNKNLLQFSQNYSIQRNYLGDKIFPDQKTQFMKAEFSRLQDPVNLPIMAMVHAEDTEAEITRRPTMDKVELEKSIIKVKINLTEQMSRLRDEGVYGDNVKDYIFNDLRNVAEQVKTRTEVMKMEVLQSGKFTIKENNLDYTVDFKVPSANKFSFNWSADTADIFADIQQMRDALKKYGRTPKYVITSTKIMNKIRANKKLQIMIGGATGEGLYLLDNQINQLVQAAFGFTFIVNDEEYRYPKAGVAGGFSSSRYINEDKFIMIAPLSGDSIGSGLWGVTAEEREQGPWTSKSASQFITLTTWATVDPVAKWSMASALFVPVLPEAYSLAIAKVTTA